MNESEKERLIKKDIESIENRVRHAFNQGYEMGLKESRSEIPNTCGDAISRQAAIEQIAGWIISGEYGFTNATDYLSKKIKALPSVTPQQRTRRWILTHKNGVNKYVCSECNNEPLLIGESYPIFKLSDYCPMCGSKMEVEE